jgi:hypothetical protein
MVGDEITGPESGRTVEEFVEVFFFKWLKKSFRLCTWDKEGLLSKVDPDFILNAATLRSKVEFLGLLKGVDAADEVTGSWLFAVLLVALFVGLTTSFGVVETPFSLVGFRTRNFPWDVFGASGLTCPPRRDWLACCKEEGCCCPLLAAALTSVVLTAVLGFDFSVELRTCKGN